MSAGDLHIVGTASTPFGKVPGRSFKDLTREANLGVLADAGLDGGGWFGNRDPSARSA